jgi:hypothetical protein
MRRHNAYLSIPNYGLLINQVDEDYIRPQTMRSGDRTALPTQTLQVEHSHREGILLAPSYALYTTDPKTVLLEPIQVMVKVHTQIPTLYSNNYDQLQQQIDITADHIYEMEENLLFNHPNYGLLNNVDARYQITTDGPPTPDLLDDMLSRVWIEPDLFVMHPEALQDFRTQANALGLALDTIERCGSSFTAWREVPIFPSDKLHLTSKSREPQAGLAYELVDRVRGDCTTEIILMRVGEEQQGVVGLNAANNEGSERYPEISVEYMGMDDDAVASYLMSMYRAAAVLTPNALAVAQVTV